MISWEDQLFQNLKLLQLWWNDTLQSIWWKMQEIEIGKVLKALRNWPVLLICCSRVSCSFQSPQAALWTENCDSDSLQTLKSLRTNWKTQLWVGYWKVTESRQSALATVCSPK
jgi:hypothetical protein